MKSNNTLQKVILALAIAAFVISVVNFFGLGSSSFNVLNNKSNQFTAVPVETNQNAGLKPKANFAKADEELGEKKCMIHYEEWQFEELTCRIRIQEGPDCEIGAFFSNSGEDCWDTNLEANN